MSRFTAGGAFVLCALPRLVFFWVAPPPELTFYWHYASGLLDYGTLGLSGVPDTVVEPLYPTFLATARWLTGDRFAWIFLWQIVVASLGGVALLRLTWTLTGSTRAAWVATLLYAFDPYLVRQSVGLMEITILTALLIATAESERRNTPAGSVFAGLFAGAAVLTRFSVAPVAIALPVLLARRSWKQAALAAAAILLVITPWSIRNQRIDGSVAPSRVGINLAVSLSDAAEQLLPIHNNDRLVPLLGVQTDRELLSSALAFARADPWRTAKMKLRNLVHVFNPRLLPYDHEPQSAQLREENGRYWIDGGIPRPRLAQWMHGLWRTMILVLAIVGFATRGLTWNDGVLWAVLITITAVCTVFYPTTRLTTPMVFVLMIWAAHAGPILPARRWRASR